MTPPRLQPGNPATALLALGLGVLAIKKAAQRSPAAGRIVFAIVAAIFTATVIFVAINGLPHDGPAP
jgi:hypothetical protein